MVCKSLGPQLHRTEHRGGESRACNIKQNEKNKILGICESAEEGEVNGKWKDRDGNSVCGRCAPQKVDAIGEREEGSGRKDAELVSGRAWDGVRVRLVLTMARAVSGTCQHIISFNPHNNPRE